MRTIAGHRALAILLSSLGLVALYSMMQLVALLP